MYFGYYLNPRNSDGNFTRWIFALEGLIQIDIVGNTQWSCLSTGMPPSQLKRLKSSLREQGVVGPQKSKKQKRQATKNGAFKESRIQRNVALQGIREQFNPFEVKPAEKKKYYFAGNSDVAQTAVRRPGVTKGLGEENVRHHEFGSNISRR